jgi:hypothetical protein
MKTESWNGHCIRVKDWELTKEIELLYIRSQIGVIADLAHESDWDLVEELVDELITYLFESEATKKRMIETEFWTWATDYPQGYLDDRIVNQVIEVKEGQR